MTFRRYGSYKKSGMDWLATVPDHWDVSRVKQLFEIKKRISGSQGYAVLSITQQGIKVKDTQSGDGQLSMDYSKYQFVEIGDFAMNHMDLLTGYVDVSSEFGVTSPDYRVFRVRDKSRCFDRYYLYLFQMGYKNKIFFAYGQGSSQLGRWRFPTDQFNGFQMPYPPMAEQRHVASFLDREIEKIDLLVNEQQRLIDLLKEKRRVVISTAVTKGLNACATMQGSGIDWLGDVPQHWAVTSVSSRYSVQLGKMLDTTTITGEHLRPYLRVVDVQWGEINTEDLPCMDFNEEARKKFRLKPGDLLINEGGSYPGRAAIWKGTIDECYYQKALHRLRPLRPREDSTRFLYFVMEWAVPFGVFSAGGNEATIEHLPAEKLRRYRFAFPPMAEQMEIASYLELNTKRFGELIKEAERATILLQERRTSLIFAAVTGKIDVCASSIAESGREVAA